MRGMEQIEPGVFQNPRSPLEVYTTVAYRVRKFRGECPDWRVDFSLLGYGVEPRVDPESKDWRPRFILMRCEIRDGDGNIRSVGHAEEDRRHGPVNKTNAIENAETSALGRALANLGYCTGNYASADEIEIAKGREQSMRDGEEKQNRKASFFKPNPDADAAALSMEDEFETDIDEAAEGRVHGKPKEQNPYSRIFVDLLAEAQTVSNAQEFGELMDKVRAARDDLSAGELEELKPIILAKRANYAGA